MADATWRMQQHNALQQAQWETKNLSKMINKVMKMVIRNVHSIHTLLKNK